MYSQDLIGLLKSFLAVGTTTRLIYGHLAVFLLSSLQATCSSRTIQFKGFFQGLSVLLDLYLST